MDLLTNNESYFVAKVSDDFGYTHADVFSNNTLITYTHNSDTHKKEDWLFTKSKENNFLSWNLGTEEQYMM